LFNHLSVVHLTESMIVLEIYASPLTASPLTVSPLTVSPLSFNPFGEDEEVELNVIN